jgi:hypothetical protein
MAGAVGENLFELRGVSDFCAGASEFSRRPIHDRNISDKKYKNKKQRGGFAFFGYYFGEAKK